MDFAILLLLWLVFASLTTHHVALALAVGQRLGKLQGWLVLLAFPLAPYFGIRAHARVMTFFWVLLLLAYAGLLLVATR